MKIGININLNINESIIQQLVIAQISATFLITALLSLVSNLENKYIYGEKAIGNIFTGKYITFTKVFYFLIFLMFTNIVIMVNNYNSAVSITIVIISLTILSWLIFCILKLFLQTKSIKQDLLIKYYKENIKILKKSRPTKNYNSNILINLRERYIYLIAKGDIDYIEFCDIYIYLIDKTLFNNKKMLQEYYTEHMRHDDLVANYIFIIDNLIDYNKIDRAIIYYNKLLEILNYHNAYISYYELFFIYEKINNYICNINNKFELKELTRNIMYTSIKMLEQAYLCSISDFSFTRLGKLDGAYLKNTIKPNIYELIYNSIYINRNIEHKDKNELFIMLFDEYRMSSFHIRNKLSDVTTFRFNKELLAERNIDMHIIGFPVAKLLLRILYNKDERNFRLFLQMNIKDDEMLFAKHIMLLSLIKIKLEDQHNNIYCEYEGINVEESLKLIKKNKLFFNDFYNLELQAQVYNNIKKNLVEGDKFKGGGYFREYFFEYKQELVDSYFSILFEFLDLSKIKSSEEFLEVEKIRELLLLLFK